MPQLSAKDQAALPLDLMFLPAAGMGYSIPSNEIGNGPAPAASVAPRGGFDQFYRFTMGLYDPMQDIIRCGRFT
jgi:hypothetical protein